MSNCVRVRLPDCGTPLRRHLNAIAVAIGGDDAVCRIDCDYVRHVELAGSGAATS